MVLLTGLKLMPRDLALLRELAHFGTMSFSQIGRAHFPGANPATVCNRLSKLVRAKMVRRFRVGMQMYQGAQAAIGVVYQITSRGLRVVKSAFASELFRDDPVPLNTSSLSHDLLLVDVLRALGKRFPNARVMCGNQIKRSERTGGRCPDAVIEWLDAKRKMAVELELTAKSSRRYGQIITSYRLMPEYEEVLYITGSRTIRDAIATQILGYKQQNAHPILPAPNFGKFKFATLDSLKPTPHSHDTKKNPIDLKEVNECHSNSNGT